ncbi:dihydrolipoamide dehydrogenase [Geothermobacter ehrlichii]|uniref:Dihydrolipoyl dehydrogenase n=1 Tax=Geothermobacter ehrlichii TaxID=213224 RepID=A0A5D3WGH1_9BACT|nr:dihydrolipoyl dehydrogenase [Geothermobacter ehrlichii]TYO95674.1 dihydrolipoamide dehydrogenase [Geothermobacter ehrlichii]
MKEFDIAVIGAGPGGYVAAIQAAQAGAGVCVIENDRPGGTCLNRGCIPTKALFSTAQMLNRLRHAADHGIDVGEPAFDYARAAERKDRVVAQLVNGVEQLLKGNGVEIFRGFASLEGPGRIRIRRQGVVGHIQARNIIIATGSLPAVPKALAVDGRNILTSTEILAIKELPESLLVVGGGYIGCEFASIFSTFGCKVTVVEALPSILANTDRQAVREVEKAFRQQGVQVLTKTAVEGLEVGDGQVTARLSGGESLTVEKVLVAIGRRPNTEGLALDSAGVATDERGAIVVDEGMRTSAEGIFAIGDVTGGIQLAHVASYQAGIAVKNALGGDARADYRVVPSSIFTLPEVSQVGLSEEQCKQQGIEVSVGRFAYMATSKAVCEGEVQGSIKLIAEKASGRILGAAIAGADASTLIAEIGAAMAAGMTAGQLGEVIHAHPTLPEMVKEAAEDVEGKAVHKVGRRKK